MDSIIASVLGFLHLSPSIALIISSACFFVSEVLGKLGHGGLVQFIVSALSAVGSALKPKG